MTTLSLKLIGSEKQIAWATKIINSAVKAITSNVERYQARVGYGDFPESIMIKVNNIANDMITMINKNTSAAQIIARRNAFDYQVLDSAFLKEMQNRK